MLSGPFPNLFARPRPRRRSHANRSRQRDRPSSHRPPARGRATGMPCKRECGGVKCGYGGRRQFRVQSTTRNVNGIGLRPVTRLMGRRQRRRDNGRTKRFHVIHGPSPCLATGHGSSARRRRLRARSSIGTNVHQTTRVLPISLPLRITSARNGHDTRTVVRRRNRLESDGRCLVQY